MMRVEFIFRAEESLMACAKCGADVTESARFCPGCGIELVKAIELNAADLTLEALGKMFEANGWASSLDDGELEVRRDGNYRYDVRYWGAVNRLTFTTYWRFKDSCTDVSLFEFANDVNNHSGAMISAVQLLDDGKKRLCVTIPVALTQKTLFADIERHLVAAESEWDRTTDIFEITNILWNPEEGSES